MAVKVFVSSLAFLAFATLAAADGACSISQSQLEGVCDAVGDPADIAMCLEDALCSNECTSYTSVVTVCVPTWMVEDCSSGMTELVTMASTCALLSSESSCDMNSNCQWYDEDDLPSVIPSSDDIPDSVEVCVASETEISATCGTTWSEDDLSDYYYNSMTPECIVNFSEESCTATTEAECYWSGTSCSGFDWATVCPDGSSDDFVALTATFATCMQVDIDDCEASGCEVETFGNGATALAFPVLSVLSVAVAYLLA